VISLQKAGGVAALYTAIAYILAIPYFLVVVNYPDVVDPAEKVALLRDNYASMYAMHVLVYEIVAIALVVLALALHHRLKAGAPALATLGAVMGCIWACLLLGSSLVFNYGMGTVVEMSAADPARAVEVWQIIELTALGLGGAGGELVGGVWVLFVTLAAMQTRALPKGVAWLGAAIALAGLLSIVPPLKDATVVFGLLQIPWFAWVGIALMRQPTEAASPFGATP